MILDSLLKIRYGRENARSCPRKKLAAYFGDFATVFKGANHSKADNYIVVFEINATNKKRWKCGFLAYY